VTGALGPKGYLTTEKEVKTGKKKGHSPGKEEKEKKKSTLVSSGGTTKKGPGGKEGSYREKVPPSTPLEGNSRKKGPDFYEKNSFGTSTNSGKGMYLPEGNAKTHLLSIVIKRKLAETGKSRGRSSCWGP